MRYKIVRIFRNSYRRYTVRWNCSLEEAQAHCKNPETSSSTCTSKVGKDRTRRLGAWMDTYSEDK